MSNFDCIENNLHFWFSYITFFIFTRIDYRVGIPNGIPLIFKFKSVNGKLVPIVQEMAVAPISGEFLEKKVRSWVYLWVCVCVGGGWGDAIVWVGVYIIYYLLTYKQSISVCVGVGVTTISVCYVFLSILHQNARQSVEDLCTCTSRTH